MDKKKMLLSEKIKKNPWILSTVVLAVIVAIMVSSGFVSTNAVKVDKVGADFEYFINSMGTSEIEYISGEDYGGNLYELTISTGGQELPAYVTKDGKYFVQVVAPLGDEVETEQTQEPNSQPQEAPEVVKADNPEIELFVMTHCPYGTQAMKGFIPAMEELEGIADLNIRYVHYYMHTNEQEEVETPRQVCIREEQSDKFTDYLKCFLGSQSGTPQEAAACEEEVGIDSDALADCIDSGRAEEYYAEDSELSENYGVRGSPTLVVNGEIYQSGRSSQAYLDTTCSSFNEVPEECGEISLESANPNPGFGYSASTGSATTAQC